MCARESRERVFALGVPGRVQNVKNCTKLVKFSVLHAKNCANEAFLNINCATEGTFLWICDSKSMDLGPNFVPVMVEFDRFCAT